MNFTTTDTAIQKLVYKIAGEENRDFISLAFGWKKIVGKLLAERAFIHKIENNTLFVAVTNNVWMQDLVLKKQMIKAKIFAQLKIEIFDIVFFITSNPTQYKVM